MAANDHIKLAKRARKSILKALIAAAKTAEDDPYSDTAARNANTLSLAVGNIYIPEDRA